MSAFTDKVFQQAIARAQLQRQVKDAMAVAKAINRRCRRQKIFAGGRGFGVDYNTWAVSYPQMAEQFNKAVKVINGGKPGRYVPKGLTQ